MGSIHRSYIPIPDAADGRFWCIDTACIYSEVLNRRTYHESFDKNVDPPYYETAVFKATKLPEECKHEYDVEYDDLDMLKTKNIDEAYENHKKMIEKWSRITMEQAEEAQNAERSTI